MSMSDSHKSRAELKKYLQELSEQESRGFEVLAQYLIDRGWTADLSVAAFAKLLKENGIYLGGDNTVRRFLDKLEDNGLVEIKRHNCRVGNTIILNFYIYRGPCLKGCVPLDSPLYVKRIADEDCINYLSSSIIQGSSAAFIKIRGWRQTGKTSLLWRLKKHLNKSPECCVVLVDLKQSNFRKHYNDIEAFLETFGKVITEGYSKFRSTHKNHDQGSDIPLSNSFLNRLLPTEKCTQILEQQVFNRLSGKRKVLLIDSLGQLFGTEVQAPFLDLLRDWSEYKLKVSDDNPIEWPSIVVAYSGELYPDWDNRNSPLQNIGTAVDLEEFNADQILGLAELYGLEWDEGVESAFRLMNLIGGHPYLVNLALFGMARKNLSMDIVEQKATSIDGLFFYHLSDYLTLLKNDDKLREFFLKVINGATPIDEFSKQQLFKIGLIKLDNSGKPQVRCELYEKYFKENLGD